jgi:hypothetical protein
MSARWAVALVLGRAAIAPVAATTWRATKPLDYAKSSAARWTRSAIVMRSIRSRYRASTL